MIIVFISVSLADTPGGWHDFLLCISEYKIKGRENEDIREKREEKEGMMEEYKAGKVRKE